MTESNPTVIPTGCHRTGCGSQRPLRARSCTCVLLAAAPTTPPCFRHWRPSSLLPTRGGFGKEAELCAMPRAPLLAGAVAAGDWGVEPSAAGGVKPHRHPYGMPPYGLRLPASTSCKALVSCWPRPQQLLPASATGGRRRCCLVGAALAKRQSFTPCQGPPY